MTPFVHAAVSSALEPAGKPLRAFVRACCAAPARSCCGPLARSCCAALARACCGALARSCCAAGARCAALTCAGCVVLALAGCAAGSASPATSDVRLPEDAPPQFVTEDGVAPRQECRSPLLDPRDQTRLRLVRSVPFGTSYRGDYEVPPARYGVREGELLRIDCETGQPVGIVRN